MGAVGVVEGAPRCVLPFGGGDDGDGQLPTDGFPPPAGSPGPPENVKVEEITDTTAQLSWKEGTDNHSPVTSYSIQARTPFSVGWQTATTGTGGRRVPPAPSSAPRVSTESLGPSLSDPPLCSARAPRRDHPHSHCGRAESVGGVRVSGCSQQQNRRWRAQFTLRKSKN